MPPNTDPYSIESCDVVVIGAGPSGAVVAHTLANAGVSVVCLEQGDWAAPNDYPANFDMWELVARAHWDPEPNHRNNTADYPLETSDTDLHPGMYSAVGGGSVHYGGVWPRMTPADFRIRSIDGVADDWPISYHDLEPFFDEVDAFLGVSGCEGDPAYPESLQYPQPPLPLGLAGTRMAQTLNELGWHWWPGPNAIPAYAHGELAGCGRWGTCGQGCPEGAKASFDIAYWPAAIRAGATLTTGARVREITVDDDGRTTGVIWVDVSGREHTLRSRYVVLCANAIGTPRLLLLSRSAQFPDGLANSSGLVGRNLMLHPTAIAMGYFEDDLETWRGPVGAVINSMQFYDSDPARGFLRGSKLEMATAPGLILGGVEPHRLLPFDQLWGDAFHDVLDLATSAVRWAAVIDDIPEESNRVCLDENLTDSSGIPAPKIEYRLSDNSRRSMEFAMDRMCEAFEAAGAVRVLRMPDVRGDPGHLLGTARMGTDPHRSVVDPYGRAHDVPNLFIADASVFVTGGGVNPTSSIVALALRSARHLLAEIDGSEVAR